MLYIIKYYFKLAIFPLLYFSGIVVMFINVFKEAIWGFFLLISLIPQPNIWYMFHKYPFGKDYLDFLFITILIGIFIQKKGFAKTNNSMFIFLLILVSYAALWNSSIRFSLPLPISYSSRLLYDWKNYAQMICLYFLALNLLKDEEKQKAAIIIILIVVLFISLRNYRNFHIGDAFNWAKRAEGPFATVGLGPNHLGAFMAYYLSTILGLFLFDKSNKWRRALCLITLSMGLHPLLFSFSRGAYIAAFGSLAFMGFVKKRSLLIICIVILVAWKTLLPPAVVDRINMTYNQETGEIVEKGGSRLMLWNQAIKNFQSNPIFGIGFGGFGFTVPKGQSLTDTHNYWIKLLSEQGIIGGLLLIVLFFKSFRSGWKLLNSGRNSFQKGIGFGFVGTTIACMIANFFGDRFSYFVLGGYFWILWGIVDRILLNLKKDKNNEIDAKADRVNYYLKRIKLLQ